MFTISLDAGAALALARRRRAVADVGVVVTAIARAPVAKRAPLAPVLIGAVDHPRRGAAAGHGLPYGGIWRRNRYGSARASRRARRRHRRAARPPAHRRGGRAHAEPPDARAPPRA